jgi:hypothetical protein
VVELVAAATDLVLRRSGIMIEYQNLFTRVQFTTNSHGPAHTALPLPRGDFEYWRTLVLLLGVASLAEAQIGPIYLGVLGQRLDCFWCALCSGLSVSRCRPR